MVRDVRSKENNNQVELSACETSQPKQDVEDMAGQLGNIRVVGPLRRGRGRGGPVKYLK